MHPSTDIAVTTPAPEKAGGCSSLDSVKKTKGGFDNFVAWIRDKSPDWVVNNGSRFNFGFKAMADVMSLWSSVRKGSSSPARLVASVVTLFTELLGIGCAEKKITEEKQKEYSEMSVFRYGVVKTKEAFNPREHILETVGLATIANGIFTVISGVNQSVKTRLSWEILQGALTAVAGLFMTYMPDRERAWQISTGVFWTRAPVAGKQAWNAYKIGVPEKNIASGDWQQGAKWMLNQTSNLFGVVFGGVKKLPDGSIIHIGKKGEDITLPKQSRAAIASIEKKELGAFTSNDAPQIESTPLTTISHASVERAMPERVEAKEAVVA